MIPMNCPKGHGAMIQKDLEKSIPFKGMMINVIEEACVCPVCSFSAGTMESAGKLQQRIADAYRKETGLLTGDDIKQLRKEKNLTQEQLAELMGVGIASIKRWETGAIQSKSMDTSLRLHLFNEVTGNRQFSIPRIRRVADAFKHELERPIIKENDQMLYAAKYLWYADMLATKILGRSMTGATYAHLPYGPQLNNYRDLIQDIQQADISKADPLTDEEQEIISRIATAFPTDRTIFDAAHKEPAWINTSNGELISYHWADGIIAKI